MSQVSGVVYRGLCVALSAGLLGVGLAGCGVRNTATGSAEGSAASTAAASASDAATTEAKSAEETEQQKVSKAYQQVLDNLATYMAFDDAPKSGLSYEYALVNITPDGAPALLVKASGADDWGGMERVRIFAYEPTAEDSIQAYAQHITVGAAGAGGARIALSATNNAHGLLYSQISSGTGTGSMQLITPEGTDLKTTFFSAVDMSQSNGNPFSAALATDIPWAQTTDATQLDSYAQGTWNSPGTATGFEPETIAKSAGYTLMSGRIHVVDALGVLSLQGEQDPNPEATKTDNQRYVLLDFGSPQNINAHSGAGPGMTDRITQFALLGYDTDGSWDALDEQNVTIAFVADGAFWPSDTSLPLGGLRMTDKSNLTVVEVG